MKATEIKSVWLTLNRQCNLRCKWCYSQNSGFSDVLTMPIALAKKLVDICLSIGVKSFILIGGEPTIYKNFFEIIRHILDEGGRITVMTNGVRLCDEVFCRQIACLDAKRCQFNISLKGISNEEYLENCGVSAFSSVVKGVRNCEHFGIRCSFIYVLSSDNVLKMVDFAKAYVANGLGKYPLNFSHCSDVLQGESFCPTECRSMTAIEVDRAFNRQYVRLYEILGDVFGLHQTLPLCMVERPYFDLMRQRNQIFTGCHLMRRTGAIFDIDGGLLLCNHLVGYAIGKFGKDYSDKDTFVNFFESELVVNYRRKLTTMPSLQCAGCVNSSLCGGGCCLRWFNEEFDKMRSEVMTRKEVKNEIGKSA